MHLQKEQLLVFWQESDLHWNCWAAYYQTRLWQLYMQTTLNCTSHHIANPTIKSRYENIAMFINYQNNQFLNKLLMIMSWNLHSGTKSSGWLRHWLWNLTDLDCCSRDNNLDIDESKCKVLTNTRKSPLTYVRMSYGLKGTYSCA